MLTRRKSVYLTLIGIFLNSRSWATPAVAARVFKVLKNLGKPALAITTSAVAGVVSAKVMKDLEHVHEDSPTILIVTYYALLDSKRVDDAKACWESIPEAHINFMRTIEKVVVWDAKEINKTPSNAAVFVSLYAKQYGREAEEWRGTINLRWHETNWLIQSMQISKRAA